MFFKNAYNQREASQISYWILQLENLLMFCIGQKQFIGEKSWENMQYDDPSVYTYNKDLLYYILPQFEINRKKFVFDSLTSKHKFKRLYITSVSINTQVD